METTEAETIVTHAEQNCEAVPTAASDLPENQAASSCPSLAPSSASTVAACEDEDTTLASATSSSSSQPLPLAPGATIRLKGLQAAPHLNGCTGMCMAWIEDKLRWKVRLQSGETRGVKAENIEVLSVATSSTATRTNGKSRQRGLVRSHGLSPTGVAANAHVSKRGLETDTQAMASLLEGELDDTSSEANLLSSLAGARCVDAADVESSVIDRCDAVATLQRRRVEIVTAEKEVSRLMRSREASLQLASSQDGDEAPASDAQAMAQLRAAESRRQALQEEIEELEARCTRKAPARSGKSRAAGRASAQLHLDFDLEDSATPSSSSTAAKRPKLRRHTNGTVGMSSGDLELPLKDVKEESPLALASLETKMKQESTAPSSSSAGYHIDVHALKPNPTTRLGRTYQKDLQTMVAQGEEIDPSMNIQKRPGFLKRRRTPDPERPLKNRREDDTSDRSFHRRQDLLAKTARVASEALHPKQSVDQHGEILKEEAPQRDIKVEEVMVGTKLQDDVVIAEGLRCPRWMWEALYPYQHKCVKWLWSMQCEKMGGILADEMGLGKTIQIIAYLAVLHHSGVLQKMTVQNTSLGTALPARTGGVLIVCPATLVAQWRSEIHLWYPRLRVCVMHQIEERERKEAIRTASTECGVLVTSYETMRIELDALLEATWVIMVLDEGQKIRNPHVNTTVAAKRFSTPHRIVLSGSPIQNKLQELWSLFDFICPGRLGTLPVFLEEFAAPIEAGNMVGSNEAKVAAAYQCAMALRELTMPCILRRTKAEVMDVLKLPAKQEQVLFCHLTQEQFVAYLNFLQTEQVAKARNASTDRKCAGAAFYSIGVLRKLCNHPDLLLKDMDPAMQPPDMWNPTRSGKMNVLAKICKVWHNAGHRVLIFVQTVMMLDIVQQWMCKEGYTHLRIDGKTPVKSRLKFIEEYNSNTEYFAMILTTRVGGVGLNIVGADRVVIFDPDWNPMTDVQARERAWRIGQKRDVAVYRLVLTGTVEEKIYQRQVYKHFLSQKVLSDPRQRQFFKWNDLADLFDVPPPPPGFDAEEMKEMRSKYKELFANMNIDDDDDQQVETTQVMKAITNLPTKDQNVTGEDSTAEHNAILQSLYDTNGIKASFNHDKVEQPLLDRKIVRDGANLIAERALSAIQRSSRERASHHISEPTWTGHVGHAGASVKHEGKVKQVKREPGVTGGGKMHLSGKVSSRDILDGLRQLTAIRAMARTRGSTQADDAARMRITGGSSISEAIPDNVGLPIELHESDRKIAEMILEAFLDPKFAGPKHSLTTGQVLQHLAQNVADHHSDLFKSLLKQLCKLNKPNQSSQPGLWTLRQEYWPVKAEAV